MNISQIKIYDGHMVKTYARFSYIWVCHWTGDKRVNRLPK